MNPPYGDEAPKWVDKFLHEWATNNITEGIVLVAARTENRWFNRLMEHSSAWCAVKGRLKFSNSKNSATFPSAIIYFGSRTSEFAAAFSKTGRIYREFKPSAQLEYTYNTFKHLDHVLSRWYTSIPANDESLLPHRVAGQLWVAIKSNVVPTSKSADTD